MAGRNAHGPRKNHESYDMMMRLFFFLLAAFLLGGSGVRAETAAASTNAPASTNAAALAPAPGSPEAAIAQIKHPVAWFTWGADVRIRNEYFNNALTLGDNVIRHEQDYFRERERIWLTLQPDSDLSVNSRLAAEQRDWLNPSYSKQFGYQEGQEDRYALLDLANVKWANAFCLPLTLTAGRQELQLGDPADTWLVLDGTPYDGSWTTSFDAMRATYNLESIQTKLDLVYLYQSALPDAWLPTIGTSSENRHPSPAVPGYAPYWLTEQNEQGVILYLSNKSVPDMTLDGFFIYKHDNQEDVIRSPYGTPLGDNADIFTVGSRISGTPDKNWKYALEGAYQFGEKEDPMVRIPVAETDRRPISAYGLNGNLTYLVKDPCDNQFSAIFEYLSGDNPKTTGKDEMFDVLWGRWPRWSELYIYSYANETGGKVAQMNNLLRLGPSWTFTPVQNTTFSLMYNALFAPEAVPTRAVTPGQFSKDGNFRGHYVQAVLKHRFSKYISAHLWAEAVSQGDYYANHDVMTFLRAETVFTF